jgi:hypothetical protein
MNVVLALIMVTLWSSPLHFIEGVARDPHLTPYGAVMTDASYSHLFIWRNDSLVDLITAPGCGRYYTLSPDSRFLGCKVNFSDGLQAPALVDLNSGEQTLLHAPCEQAGQVSFSENGTIAYTIGDELLIQRGSVIQHYALGSYVNYTRISPDGTRVVFNDQNDQLWVLSLSGNTRSRIPADRIYGYCLPHWSPDSRFILYRRLDGYLNVYDTEENLVYELPQGEHARWSPDGEYVVYHAYAIKGHQVIGSDLYRVRFDGSECVRLTDTPDQYEIDPGFCGQDGIVFSVIDMNAVYTARIVNNALPSSPNAVFNGERFKELPFTVKGAGTRDSLDVPYLNQVYDTPDWFNGHWACAPSTAMMAIAYYAKLPVWSCTCSMPYNHVSDYGRYICEHYRYREIDYTWQAQDPGGNWATGGYGYMWSGSNRPYTHMVPYFNNHGIASWRDDSPTFSETVAEIDAGYPYGMCVGLTTAGHLVLAVGQVLTWHTLICNDPYGDKNTPGYPSYDGKYARYDWPGYNNGYENLNTVYWCTGIHGDWEPLSDTIVDDLQFHSGFYLHTAVPSSMEYWRDALTGYNNHMWWTYTTAATTHDTCYAIWTPRLPSIGEYEIFAFIPDVHAHAVTARYWIQTIDTVETVILDQSLYSDEWVSLGVYNLDTATALVRLGDATGIQGQHIGYDALKWSFQGPGIEEEDGCAISFSMQSSNPVSGCIFFSINGAKHEPITMKLFNTAGQCVRERTLHLSSSGAQQIVFDVSNCASGIYFVTMAANCDRFTGKVVIIND